jgi:hypothetical protein
LTVSARKESLRNPNLNIALDFRTLSIREPGPHEFSLYDMTGNLLGRRMGSDATDYSLPELENSWKLEKGIYSVRVKTAKGTFVQNLSML